MASAKPLMALARTRPAVAMLTAPRAIAPAARPFSSTPLRAATTEGPPPQNFRLPKPERWNEAKESTWDKAGNYFLLTEMMRGMYVVLEQFFRPP